MPAEHITAREIAESQPERLTLDQYRRLNLIDALTLIVEQAAEQGCTSADVHRWLHNIAAVRGEELPCRRLDGGSHGD